MADSKTVCPNCNTPQTIKTAKADGTLHVRCKRCFKKTPFIVENGIVTGMRLPKSTASAATAEDAQQKEKK